MLIDLTLKMPTQCVINWDLLDKRRLLVVVPMGEGAVVRSGWMSWDVAQEMSGWPTALTEDGEWRTVILEKKWE